MTTTRAARRPPTDWRDDPSFPATVALTALTLSVAVGFGRLFSDGGFLLPVIFATLSGHGVAWWCRRNDLPTGLAAIATLGAVGLVAAWTILGHTTAYGLPLPLTVRSAVDLLAGARQSFSTVKAPASSLPGFVLATILALGISSFMADWAAFRLLATFEAIIPTFTLFLFTAALGTPRHRIWATALFIGAVLGFLVVQGLARANRAGAWFGGRAAGGPTTMLRGAIGLGAVALVLGLVVGPLVPGPNDPIVKYKNRVAPGPNNRATISPLVDIRGRIVDQRDEEVFTVKAAEPSYWRITSLDTFDGAIWSSNSTYRDVRGPIRTDEVLEAGLPTLDLEQEFSISALRSIWLPAAFRPQRTSGVDDVSFAGDTASLITPEDTTDGLVYTVRSRVPKATPAQLDAAPAQAPQAVIDRYLALPANVSPRVRAEARRIVGTASTPYQRALALQNHFKTKYAYDLNVAAGHDEGSLEKFLFQSKAGYCEQFAGVYAVLARAIGLPARVAVGFTPGDFDPDDGLYHVKGGHGHAWAEVYLHGFGWVEFDPTPGRGDPQASGYTGLAPAQEEIREEAATTVPTTAVPGAEADTTATTNPIFGEEPAPSTGADEGAGLPAIAWLVLAVAGLAALWALVVPGLHTRRRRRRRRLPGTAAQVLADWNDTAEVLAAAGVTRRPSETMSEYANRAASGAGLQPEPAQALRRLAADASVAAYAAQDVADDVVTRSAAHAHAVRTAVFEQVSMTDRLTWWLDPRPLVGSGDRS